MNKRQSKKLYQQRHGYNPGEEERIQLQISDMCDLYDEKCEELEKAKMHWIPVSDQIPDVEDLHDISIDHCTGYLVQTRSGGMMIAHYIRVFGDAYFECRTLPIRDVVAWMPLPEPYRRNGGKRL